MCSYLIQAPYYEYEEPDDDFEEGYVEEDFFDFDWPPPVETVDPDDEIFWEPEEAKLDLTNGYLILAVLFIILLGAAAISNHVTGSATEQISQGSSTSSGGQPYSFEVDDPTAVTAPYKEYTITQGLHGQSYGHLAIDLAAGRGASLISPVNGFVTALFTDEYGNTTLVIENDVYTVTMLHGDFNVSLGDELHLGQVVGVEGNNGYTMDMFGNLCYGREHCGNHTHLNIFDKRLQANVNPLNFIR